MPRMAPLALALVIAAMAALAVVSSMPPRPARPTATAPAPPPAQELPMQYTLTATYGPFFDGGLVALATDAQGRLWLAGEQELRVLDAAGQPLARHRLDRPARSLAVGPDGRVYVGQDGRVRVLGPAGQPVATLGEGVLTGPVTAVAAGPDALWLAEGSGSAPAALPHHRVRRLSLAGQPGADLHASTRDGSVRTPSGSMDLALTAGGVLWLTHPGKHRVEAYGPEGRLVRSWGRFSQTDPAGFTGCCNPQRLSPAGPGRWAVTQKAPPMVKLFDAEGNLLADIGPEPFAPACPILDVAAGADGTLYVADTATGKVHRFEPAGEP